jgi:hypothetical protein
VDQRLLNSKRVSHCYKDQADRVCFKTIQKTCTATKPLRASSRAVGGSRSRQLTDAVNGSYNPGRLSLPAYVALQMACYSLLFPWSVSSRLGCTVLLPQNFAFWLAGHTVRRLQAISLRKHKYVIPGSKLSPCTTSFETLTPRLDDRTNISAYEKHPVHLENPWTGEMALRLSIRDR